MILGRMSSGLLPRVCAFGVPGQSKTHGHSVFENDFEDLVTDLPATFVANDVPAAFCAPEVFVDAAMIASDYWVSLIGAALSALNDAMLCLQKSMQTDDLGASSLMGTGVFWGRFLVSSGVLRIVANSGSFRLVPSCGFMAVRVLGVFAETGGCCSYDFGVLGRVEWETLFLVQRCDRRVEWLLRLCAWPQSSCRSALQRPMLSLVSRHTFLCVIVGSLASTHYHKCWCLGLCWPFGARGCSRV